MKTPTAIFTPSSLTRLVVKAIVALLIFFVLFAPPRSPAEPSSSSKPSSKEKAHHWTVLTFVETSPAGDKKYPNFQVRPDNGTKGLCLYIDFSNPECSKPNMISTHLHRENGETVDSVGGNLNAPSPEGTTMSPRVPGSPEPPPTAWTVQTSFPWGKNNLDESWIEVSMGQDRYWLEIPYGFDRNPEDPLPPAISEKRPPFAAPMKTRGDHDHIVPWDIVSYDFGTIQNDWKLTVDLSNTGDGAGEVVLYREKGAWDLHTPRTTLTAIDADGSEINSTCTAIRRDEDLVYGRRDTFSLNRYPYYERCWGQIEAKVDGKSYRMVIPSSLYNFGQGHPASP